MAKKVEDVIRGAGMFLSLISLLVEKVREFGGSIDDIYRLITPSGAETLRQIAQVIVRGGKSLSDMIAQCKFDYANPNITEANFPRAKGRGKRKVKVKLCHPNQYFKNGDEAIAWLRKNKPGYRDATLWELLVLAIAQPDLQRQFPIAALGSIWLHAPGYRDFASLYGGDSRRLLVLGRLEGGFCGSWRFALVREQS